VTGKILILSKPRCSLYYIELNKNTWLHSKCSSQHWKKNYFCHHVIYIAVNHKFAQFLDTHMTIPIGQTRSVGRPKGMKGNDRQVSSSDSEKITKQKEKIKKKLNKKKTGPKTK
jgi:hypothetical protein